jgi:hypothetical protein
MELGNMPNISIQEVYYKPSSYFYPPVGELPVPTKSGYGRFNEDIEYLCASILGIWWVSKVL